jgi:hypothetical protein
MRRLAAYGSTSICVTRKSHIRTLFEVGGWKIFRFFFCVFCCHPRGREGFRGNEIPNELGSEDI